MSIHVTRPDTIAGRLADYDRKFLDETLALIGAYGSEQIRTVLLGMIGAPFARIIGDDVYPYAFGVLAYRTRLLIARLEAAEAALRAARDGGS